MEAGLSDERVHIVLDEKEAVEAAFKLSQKDDLVVLMVDKPAQSWEQLNALTGHFFAD
jgi:hypothetical protein